MKNRPQWQLQYKPDEDLQETFDNQGYIYKVFRGIFVIDQILIFCTTVQINSVKIKQYGFLGSLFTFCFSHLWSTLETSLVFLNRTT